MHESFDIPIALFFFNRPQSFEKVFTAIKKQKPRQLFLIQDGPRSGNKADMTQINECRKIAKKN